MGVKDNFIYEECMKELRATYGERQPPPAHEKKGTKEGSMLLNINNNNVKSNTLMGQNLKKLQHHQWGTITGYANECIVAVLKDEIAHLKSKLNDEDTSISILNTTISTLTHRVKELERVSQHE